MSEQHDAVDGPDAEIASTPTAEEPTLGAIEQTPAEAIDLDAIERDLTDVQRALDRLNDGSYWTDEVTGETIPDEVLVANPLTRTVAAS